MVTTRLRGETAQDRINGQLYSRPDLVQLYAHTHLTPPEAVTLSRYRDDIADRRVLDLGCGAGRLAAHLRPLTKGYVGADISEHMLAYCRQRFPDLAFHQQDMRALDAFDAGSFDTVFAVFNLFDAVSHADRLVALAEARRVLKPGGLLIFSAHNRAWRGACAGPRFHWQANPLRALVDYLRCVANHRRIRTQQRYETDYALLNDEGHDFAVLHYYIDRHTQGRQLANAGFKLLECLDEMGQTLDEGSDAAANPSIHYIARVA